MAEEQCIAALARVGLQGVVRAHECILGKLFGIFAAARETQCKAIDTLPVDDDLRLECLVEVCRNCIVQITGGHQCVPHPSSFLGTESPRLCLLKHGKLMKGCNNLMPDNPQTSSRCRNIRNRSYNRRSWIIRSLGILLATVTKQTGESGHRELPAN